ncbi:hypothetical protein SEA_RONA_60 [Microbacterium phage Rona]|nr:hypothetical protein SEA_RONA_60 [Microbacterium phage Rona]
MSAAKAPKVPTPVGLRTHTFRRGTRAGTFGLIRPSRIGIARYGIRDLGWQDPSKYVSKAGAILKGALA